MYLLTYFVIKYQFKSCHDLIKYHYSVTMTNSMSFDDENKSKAIITFLGKEKPRLIEEHQIYMIKGESLRKIHRGDVQK